MGEAAILLAPFQLLESADLIHKLHSISQELSRDKYAAVQARIAHRWAKRGGAWGRDRIRRTAFFSLKKVAVRRIRTASLRGGVCTALKVIETRDGEGGGLRFKLAMYAGYYAYHQWL